MLSGFSWLFPKLLINKTKSHYFTTSFTSMEAWIGMDGLMSTKANEGQTNAEIYVAKSWNWWGLNLNLLSKWGTILAKMNNVGDDAKGGGHASGLVDLEAAN